MVLSIIFSLISFLATIFYFPETLPKEKIHYIPDLKTLFLKVFHSLDSLKLIARETSLRPLFLAFSFMYASFAIYSNFATQFLASFRNFSQTQLGVYYFLFGASTFFTQTFFAYKILDKYNIDKKIVYISSLLGFFVITFSFAASFYFVLLNATFLMIFINLILVYSQVEISKVKSEHKGVIM